MTSYFAALTTIEIIFLSLFFGLFIIQLLYILICYLQPLFLIKDENKGIIHYNNSEIGVSVIVYAYNDYENLRNNLASILEQDYSNFEVIVVNDG